jgi:hypothetical protein
MEYFTIREVNSEILVFLDYNHPSKLSALKAAARLLAQEVVREEYRVKKSDYIDGHNDGQRES